MELVLMRHGKAEERGSRVNDDERELTAKGQEKVMMAAKGLANLLKDGTPVTIWTSPLKRALQTAELVAAAIKGAEIIIKEPVATGDLDSLCKDMKEFDREGTLIIIGHEPYLSHWGARIAGVILLLKTAAAMAINMSSVAPPEGSLLWFAHAQALKRIAPIRTRPQKVKAQKK